MHKTIVSQVSRLSGYFLIVLAMALLAPAGAIAADRTALERSARSAHQKLIARVPAAKALSGDALAVLVFPKITKAGLIVGGQYGEGVLFKGGKVAGYYSTAGASYGLQAGAQQYGYAMFFMNEKALNVLNANDGFEVGVGPSLSLIHISFLFGTTLLVIRCRAGQGAGRAPVSGHPKPPWVPSKGGVYGVSFVILLPCRPIPAIRPFWPKMKA